MRQTVARLLVAGIVVLIAASSPAIAATPSVMNYQGILTNGLGAPQVGTFSVTFSIYGVEFPSADPSLWSETQSVTTNSAGQFNIGLGTVSPLSDAVFSGPERWLAVRVSPELADMSPRTRVSSVAYAFRPATVDGASGGNITSKVAIGTGHSNFGTAAFVAGNANFADGEYSVVSGGTENEAAADYSTVSGGSNNHARGLYSTVSGGGGVNDIDSNSASGEASTISGGYTNTASGAVSTIGGGTVNQATNEATTVGGGNGNLSSGLGATVGGGANNKARGQFSVVAGGGGRNDPPLKDGSAASTDADSNVASGDYSAVGSGSRNIAGGFGSVVAGGYANTGSGPNSFIGSGRYNKARGFASVVGGGGGFNESDSNSAHGDYATIGGGRANRTNGVHAVVAGGSLNLAGDVAAVGGGSSNEATGTFSFVGGGTFNFARGTNSIVAGGGGAIEDSNLAEGDHSVIGGGARNRTRHPRSVIAGGFQNSALINNATVSGGSINTAGPDGFGLGAMTIAGGVLNTALGSYSVISGGRENSASNQYATIPGGFSNEASGVGTFAAGTNSTASHSGQLRWTDQSLGFGASSSGANQFVAKSSGGFYLYTDAALTSGVQMNPGDGAWASVSDRDVKENIEPVNGDVILARLSLIPIAKWNYKAQDDEIRHIGPMAQDFRQAFGLGNDDKHISTIDADGVALAAIQALLQRVRELESKIADLQKQ